jgi:hypothetical protein
MDNGDRKSSKVPLVLMGAVAGAVALPAMFSSTDVQRNRYNSREDCIADYSDAQCNPDFPLGTTAHTYYHGPWYRSDVNERARDTADPGPGRYFHGGGGAGVGSKGAPASVETGTRGGFGSSGRVSARGS